MENLKDHNFKCTGCFLCEDICPTKAIELILNEEGFYEYNIDEKKCIKCGLCVKKCPKLNNIIFNDKKMECYAVYSKDEEIVKNSSSGGYFSELAKVILQEGGIVVGATWDNGTVKHILIDSIDELAKLRSSKYLQSNLKGVYNDVKKCLDNKKMVLFSGTPCQISALKNFVKDSEKLITIDVVCHGVPSKNIFCQSLNDRFKKQAKKVNFRDKSKSWTKYSLKYDSKLINMAEDTWFMGYLENKYLKEDCYNCPFVSEKRIGDITLGDFWGINRIDPDFYEKNQDRGISLVLLNTEKAKMLFEKTKKNIISKKENANEAFKFNPRLFNGKYDEKYIENRKKFFKDYNEGKIKFKNYSTFDKLKKFIRKIANKLKRMIGSK